MSETAQNVEDFETPIAQKIESPKPDKDLEIEVIDDRPQADQKVSRVSNDDDVDNEIEGIGDRTKKRIDKLKYDYHEERRSKEQASRTRDEAIQYAQSLQQENEKLKNTVSRSEGALINSLKTRSTTAIDAAKAEYRTAYDAGDTDKLLDAQEKLNSAFADKNYVENYVPQSSPQPQNNQQQQISQQQSMQDEMGPRENDFGPIQGLTADASLYQPQLPFASSISAPQQQQFQQGMPARYGQRVPPRYGRGRGFAEGGLASVQEAGMVTDGGMKLEEEVLAAVLGQHPNPDEVFKQYIDAYGEEGLMELLAMIEQMMPAEGRMVEGAGDGLNDAIPAMIEGQQPAALSKDEYVIPADVVSHAGNGSSQAGGQKFDQLVSQVRKNKTGNDIQPEPMELQEVVKQVV